VSDESDDRYELKRLRMENMSAGELLSEIAVALGAINTSRESILSKIAALQEKASQRDATFGEGRSAQIVRNIALEVQSVSGMEYVFDERLVTHVKSMVAELRRLRELKARTGRSF